MSELKSSTANMQDVLGQPRTTAADHAERMASSLGADASEAAEELKSATPTDDLGGGVAPTSTVKHQVEQAKQQAKAAVASIADDARARMAGLLDEQKNRGADQVAGVARAAHSAAGDLQQTSPQLARLIHTAADNVGGIADDLRTSDLAGLLNSLAAFGRRQPVMFFGGAVLAGFALARFLKSDAPAPTLYGSGDDLHTF